MNFKKSSEISEELLNKVISAAYGDAGFIDSIIVRRKIKKNPELKKLFDEFRATSNALKSIEEIPCPSELIDRIKANQGIKKTEKGSPLFDLYTLIFKRPFLSTAAVSIIIMAVLASILFNENKYQYNYSNQQIELADKQVKESLMFVSTIFNRAQKELTNNVLNDRVAKPFSESLLFVNKLFNKGDIK